jgi:hypothetical protein
MLTESVAPEQILDLCHCKEDVRNKVHSVIDKFSERGLRSPAVARQEVPERTKESEGSPWQFDCCLYLILLTMIVLKQSVELLIWYCQKDRAKAWKGYKHVPFIFVAR